MRLLKNIIYKITENNFKLLKIIIAILIIILLISVYKLDKFYKNKDNIFLKTDKYTQFKILEDNCNIIKNEIPDFDINKDMLSRKQDVWLGDKMDDFAEKINKNVDWFKAWSNTDSWYNYPLIYKNKFVGDVESKCPNTCNILKSFNNIRIAGFSLLTPNGDIQPHNDSTGPTYNSMALNMLLTGTKSSLYVKPYDHINYYQHNHKIGEAIIFNAEQYHFADNKDDSYRVILYIDFDIN